MKMTSSFWYSTSVRPSPAERRNPSTSNVRELGEPEEDRLGRPGAPIFAWRRRGLDGARPTRFKPLPAAAWVARLGPFFGGKPQY